MIANLPLLFADGNPTALSKIKARKLEKFITFMVTCSWGHDTAKEIRQPPWWPSNVAFSHPFVRPQEVPEDWELRLKSLVKKCYDFHKSTFLLVFSAQLARYQHKKLRYVDNRDHTTSLYYRPNGRLLVTFRNENLFYDRDTIEAIEPYVKSTDIYLCDNCDSHFDNLEVLQAHERLCNNEIVPSSQVVPTGGLPEFLSALKLLPLGEKYENKICKDIEADSRPRNARSAANIDRGPPYPFSSLAYMKNAKINAQRDTSFSRERIERYCCVPASHSKNLVSKGKGQFPVRYRRPIDYWHRRHVFPDQRKKKILDLKAQLMLLKCRPVSVDVQRMSTEKMQEYIDKLRDEAESKQDNEDKDIVFVDADQPPDNEVKSGDPLKSDCEVIDLCSDDETPSVNENCDPRAGVTCVMRGGAVLRRTAATPQALPAEPCGARQRPLGSLILQPHPVILITHTLNNLQAIALD
ncbi:uncharacterized protein LOC120626619 [Pararge aegeria]|uniref:Jg5148 protein n=2 Tax=Pararge aegeria TaxID=116150 RepID=A0A8S4S074_9NEOP|nr:uncharacterized protein LOC120626619 [Pararge aegeria]CAH2244798.1 jg5148 [Pararge aegeria aegeria]